MRKFAIIAALAAFGLAAPAVSHPEPEDEYRPRRPSTAELAQEAINQLVEQKKLPASWTSAKLVTFDYRDKNGGQYVLTYENAAIKQAAKKKLFVVMTTDGKLVSTGHKLI